MWVSALEIGGKTFGSKVAALGLMSGCEIISKSYAMTRQHSLLLGLYTIQKDSEGFGDSVFQGFLLALLL